MTPSLEQAAALVADDLVAGFPERGPSAAVVGFAGPDVEVVVARGRASGLDPDGVAVPGVPLAPEPVFDVASVTKLVTTLLCLDLVSRRRLALDDPAARWFPELSGVSVRDLLEHRAGLWEWWPTYAGHGLDREAALDVVRRLPPRSPRGDQRRYSDLGFMLLGQLAALVSDAPLEEAVGEAVLDPLGMASSGFRPPGSPPDDRVVATSLGDRHERRMLETGTPYPVDVPVDAFTGWRTHVLRGEANDGNCWHGFGGVAGHAGLFTSVPDLLRLGHAVLASLTGHGRWDRGLVEQFTRPGRDPGQALGFRVEPGRVGPVIGHPGFTGARLAVLPAHARVIVMLTNRLHTPGPPPAVDDAWDRLVEAGEEDG